MSQCFTESKIYNGVFIRVFFFQKTLIWTENFLVCLFVESLFWPNHPKERTNWLYCLKNRVREESFWSTPLVRSLFLRRDYVNPLSLSDLWRNRSLRCVSVNTHSRDEVRVMWETSLPVYKSHPHHEKLVDFHVFSRSADGEGWRSRTSERRWKLVGIPDLITQFSVPTRPTATSEVTFPLPTLPWLFGGHVLLWVFWIPLSLPS